MGLYTLIKRRFYSVCFVMRFVRKICQTQNAISFLRNGRICRGCSLLFGFRRGQTPGITYSQLLFFRWIMNTRFTDRYCLQIIRSAQLLKIQSSSRTGHFDSIYMCIHILCINIVFAGNKKIQRFAANFIWNTFYFVHFQPKQKRTCKIL